MLKSCLEEGKGPAVYVVPDNFLVNQVCSEANRLGIKTVQSEETYEFYTNQAILVINIQKLVNGRSVFGMRSENNLKIGSILIDDVHACLDIIYDQFSISVPYENKLYSEIVSHLKPTLEQYSEQDYQKTIEIRDPFSRILVPFWIWQKNYKTIQSLITSKITEDFTKFNLPLLEDVFSLCNCVISSKKIEITPKCIPISKITSLENAERRIFMSATLLDDSVFVSALGLSEKEISNIITPEKANDIGDRMFLFPQALNSKITDEELLNEMKNLSSRHNVVVIVPSRYRAKFWEAKADLILDSTNINTEIAKMKDNHIGLVVLVNRYDGIDLPDNACRVLVIDGLPNTRSEYDSYVYGISPNNQSLLSQQMQKIEQGIGRGVRSNNDYCVSIFMGKKLIESVFNQQGYRFFSQTTQKQFELSKALWEQLLEKSLEPPTLDSIIDLSNYTIGTSRNIDWIKYSRDYISNSYYSSTPNIDNLILAQRRSFVKAESGLYNEAVQELQSVKDKVPDDYSKGYILQLMAEYKNFVNPEEAQQLLISGRAFNKGILRPINGMQHNKVRAFINSQAQSIIEYIDSNDLSPNGYLLKANAIIESLIFSHESSMSFEAALKDLSFILGIESSRPDFEYGRGPDNLWAVDNNHYLVIECKNGTTTDLISKHDCNQLNGSIIWFENEYVGLGSSCSPIMIHNSNIFDYACSPNKNIKIITPDKLELLRKNVLSFSQSLADVSNFRNLKNTDSLLRTNKLRGEDFFSSYTVEFSIKK